MNIIYNKQLEKEKKERKSRSRIFIQNNEFNTKKKNDRKIC